MDKNKISYLKEIEIQKNAKKNFEFAQNLYAQDPIKAKFLAFLKTKKETKEKDTL